MQGGLAQYYKVVPRDPGILMKKRKEGGGKTFGRALLVQEFYIDFLFNLA